MTFKGPFLILAFEGLLKFFFIKAGVVKPVIMVAVEGHVIIAGAVASCCYNGAF